MRGSAADFPLVSLCLLALLLWIPRPAEAVDDGITEHLTVPAGSFVSDRGQPRTVAAGLTGSPSLGRVTRVNEEESSCSLHDGSISGGRE